MDWLQNVDGDTRYQRQGPDRFVISADIPLTRIDAAGLSELKHIKPLGSLALSGFHFPTSFAEASDLRAIADSGRCERLSLHGAGLLAAELQALVEVVRSLTLTSLDVAGLPVSERLLEEIIAAAPALGELTVGWTPRREGHRFTPAPITFGLLRKLHGLKRVEGLGLRGLAIADDHLADMPPLGHLRFLDLGETRVTDQAFVHLRSAVALQRLYLDACPIRRNSRLALDGLRGLTELSLSNTSVGDTAVADLSALPNLQRLELSSTEITDDACISLARLDSLNALSISYTGVGLKGLTTLTKSLPHLTKLDLFGTSRTAEEVGILAGLKGCRQLSLEIDGDPQSWKALANVEGRIRLRATQFPGSDQLPHNIINVSMAGALNASAMDRMLGSKTLEVLGLPNGGEAFSHLQDGLPRVRELFLENDLLDDTGFTHLAKRPHMEAFYISGNRITDVGIAALRDARFVHTLELRNTEIGDEACETLLRLPALHCLDVPGTHVTDRGVARLAEAPNLQSLALDGRQLTEASAHALAKLQSLVELYLYGKDISASVIELAAPFPRLIELNLIDVSLDDAAVSAIAMLPHLRVLRIVGHASANFAKELRSVRPTLVIQGDFLSTAGPPVGRAAGRHADNHP